MSLSRYSFRINPKLRVAAGLVEKVTPDYDIKQSNPVIAAKDGIGNCVAKAVIGGILLEKAQLLGPKPVLAWNTHTHPKIGVDMFGRTRILNGHAQLVVATVNQEITDISGLSFNPDGTEASNWEVFDFNEDEDYAEVNSGGDIRSTPQGLAVGFVIDDWHNGAKLYSEALGENESIYHIYTREQITHQVTELLQDRDLLLKLDPSK